MPRKYKRQLGSRRYADYTKEKLEECLLRIRNKEMTQREAATYYNIPRRTLINKLKIISENKEPRRPGFPPIFTEEEETEFLKCIIQLSEYGFPVTPLELRFIVRSYLNRTGRTVTRFKENLPGNEWVISFTKRHPQLTMRFASNIKKCRAAVNEKTLRDYIDNLDLELKDVPATNIWNFDESNLTDDPGKKKVLTKRGTKYPENICNTSKTSISLMFAGNAAGEMMPPYVVYKSTHLWDTWTQNGPKGCRYSNTPSGWFDINTFNDWFEFMMLPRLKKQNGKKVIICDNLTSHITPHVLQLCEKHCISFICLPPNSSHLTQPLDVALFRPLKGAWRNILSEWKASNHAKNESVLPKQSFPFLLKKLVEVISETSAANLKSGFEKCGICPTDVNKLLSRLPGYSVNDKEAVQDSFLDSLSAKRTEWTEGAPCNKRRKKVPNLIPGKSILSHDIRQDENNAGNTQVKDTGANKGGKNHKRNRNLKKTDRMSTDEEDSSEISIMDSSDDDIENMIQLVDNEFEEGFDIIEQSNVPEKENFAPTIGQHVIFLYEGEYFPGTITEIRPEEAKISSMQKSVKSWKWPDPKDEIFYPFDDIIRRIKPPKPINRRGLFSVPELDRLWG